MARFVCVGDLHLGQGAGLYPERLSEQEDAWRRILTLAREEQVEAVLFAGDMWERRTPSPAEYLAAERPLIEHNDELGPPVIAIAGNHDRPGVSDHLALRVLDEARLIDLYTEPGFVGSSFVHRGLAVAALPWTPVSRLVAAEGGGDRDDINLTAAALLVRAARDLREQIGESSASILMAHWSVSGSSLPSGLDVGQLREPVLPIGELEQLGFDAIVLGHIHRAQMIVEPVGVTGPGAIFYTGSPMPLNFGESRVEHGVWILDLNDEGGRAQPSAEFRPIESRPFVQLVYPDVLHEAEPPDITGAVVWARVAENGGDPTEIRASLVAGGAHYVRVTVEAQPRIRVTRTTEIDEGMGPAEQLDLWLRETGAANGEAEQLVDRGRGYLEGVS